MNEESVRTDLKEEERDEIRNRLVDRNPFVSNSASNPWENMDPDVTSLNEETCARLCSLIREQSVKPWPALAGLVLGEAGLGKTHLQRRLLTWVRENNNVAVFVFVRPFLNPKRRLHHLLHEIATNLARVEQALDTDAADPAKTPRKKRKVNQFEFLVSRIIDKYLKERERKFKEGPGLGSVIEDFRRRFPDISGNLLKAVFDYRDESKRVLILDWLRGGINEEFATRLGFPDREGSDAYDLEEEASHIIRSLGMLLEYCRMSMVVCFDQLESLREKPLILAFNDVTHFLVNDVPAMLPLVFARWDIWDQRLEKNIDIAVRERLNVNRFRLETCSKEQALALVRARIYDRFPADEAREKYRWLAGRLLPKLWEDYSPRQVIELANHEILYPSEAPPIEPPAVTLAREYHRERERVAVDFDLWPPDADRLIRALLVFLKNRSVFSTVRTVDDKYISLRALCAMTPENSAECAFIVNTAGHAKTVEAALARGIRFLESGKEGEAERRCWYITDGRCRFCPPEWKKAGIALEAFQNLGGIVLALDRRRAVDWYALVALVFRLESGDIDLPLAAGLRPATEKDLGDYIRETFERDLLQTPASAAKKAGKSGRKKSACAKEENPKPTGEPVPFPDKIQIPEEREELLEKTVTVLLKESPMDFLSMPVLQEKLAQEGLNVEYELLLEFINKRPGLFTIFPVADGSIVRPSGRTGKKTEGI